MTDFGRRTVCPECPEVVANILPKTGQTTSYADYDDGYFEKGWNDEDRFTDNEDGTVTDNATGLMWPKDGSEAGANNGASGTWQEAIDFAEALDFAEHQDWRVPNITELHSIRNFNAYDPMLDPIFENVPWALNWTSTTNPGFAAQAFALDLWEAWDASRDKGAATIKVLPCRTA